MIAAIGAVAGAQTTEKLTPYADVVSYNNYYEFGLDKDEPARNAHTLKTRPWTVRIEGLVPLDEGVKIITASSDHLLVDLEDAAIDYKLGDILRFRPDYTAMLSASTSPYVTKIFEGK